MCTVYVRCVARIILTAAARRRASKSRILAALRHAGMPEVIHGKYVYFIGIDGRGVELELILVPHDTDDDAWVVIHAMPTEYRERGR